LFFVNVPDFLRIVVENESEVEQRCVEVEAEAMKMHLAKSW